MKAHEKHLRILAVVFILLISSGAVFAQKATRATFKKGAVSATVSGQLSSYKSRVLFIIRVHAGQMLVVKQLKSDDSTRYVTLRITNPAGEDVTDSDASCNNNKTVENTSAGDYKISVSECMKANEWSGNFRLQFTVK